MDARTNSRMNVARSGPEASAHFANTLLDDPLHSATPSGVKHPNRPPLRIRKYHRQAIGRLYRQHDPRMFRDYPVSN
jgi:hypothetical protein